MAGPPAPRPRRLRGPRPDRRAAARPGARPTAPRGGHRVDRRQGAAGSRRPPRPAGTTTPSARPLEEGTGQTRDARGPRSRSRPRAPRGAHVQVGPEGRRELGRRSSSPASDRPGGTSFWPSRLTRPSMLVVVPGRSCAMATGRTTSACSSSLPGREPTTTTESAAPRARSARGPSGKSPRGSPPSGPDLAPCSWRRSRRRFRRRRPMRLPDGRASPRRAEDLAASRPRSSGTEPHAAPYQARPDVEGDPPGQQARGEAHVEGTVHVAAPQSRAGTGHPATPAASRRRPPRPPRRARPATAARGPPRRPRRSARSSRQPATGAPRPGPRGSTKGPRGGPEALDHAVVGDEGLRDAGGLAGPQPERHGRVGREGRRRWGLSSTTGVAPSTADSRSRRKRTGSSSRRSPESSTTARGASTPRRSWPGAGRARPRRAGRPRAGRRPSRCRSPPWPAAPGVGVLVGEPGAAEHGDRPAARARRGRPRAGRPPRRAPRSTTTETSSPLLRTSGSVNRPWRTSPVSWVSPAKPRPSVTGTARVTARRAGVPTGLVAVDRLEAEATLVAQPALVHRLGVDPEQADEAVRRRLDAPPGTRRRTSCTSTRPGSRSHGRAVNR